jgi:hypothetical protein
MPSHGATIAGQRSSSRAGTDGATADLRPMSHPVPKSSRIVRIIRENSADLNGKSERQVETRAWGQEHAGPDYLAGRMAPVIGR